MHHHCEIILPPTTDIQTSLNVILAQFYENTENASHAFWDWWVVGGRWSGQHQLARFDKKRLDSFSDLLEQKKITVSGFRAGKPELSPSDQMPVVDDLWKKHFPEYDGEHCPLFKHAGQQILDDICLFSEIPKSLEASRVIFADAEGKATFMLSDSIWNGVNHEKTAWDGSVSGAIVMFEEHAKHYREEYRERVLPRADWLAATIDYHS